MATLPPKRQSLGPHARQDVTYRRAADRAEPDALQTRAQLDSGALDPRTRPRINRITGRDESATSRPLESCGAARTESCHRGGFSVPTPPGGGGNAAHPGSGKRQGSSVSQFVREAALLRATMAADDNQYPVRALAAQLRAIGDQGYALAEKAMKVAEEEAERKQ